MTQRILFVCLGNICRSPSAEAVTRQMATAQGHAVTLDSAGTGNWHIGKPPYAPMQNAARARGYDLADLRARQVTKSDFTKFDLIICMDDENLADLKALAPADGTAKLALFTDYATASATFVPDPYFTRDFDSALTLIEDCAQGLLSDLDN